MFSCFESLLCFHYQDKIWSHCYSCVLQCKHMFVRELIPSVTSVFTAKDKISSSVSYNSILTRHFQCLKVEDIQYETTKDDMTTSDSQAI
jgi:hypothetical protein